MIKELVIGTVGVTVGAVVATIITKMVKDEVIDAVVKDSDIWKETAEDLGRKAVDAEDRERITKKENDELRMMKEVIRDLSKRAGEEEKEKEEFKKQVDKLTKELKELNGLKEKK